MDFDQASFVILKELMNDPRTYDVNENDHPINFNVVQLMIRKSMKLAYVKGIVDAKIGLSPDVDVLIKELLRMKETEQ